MIIRLNARDQSPPKASPEDQNHRPLDYKSDADVFHIDLTGGSKMIISWF